MDVLEIFDEINEIEINNSDFNLNIKDSLQKAIDHIKNENDMTPDEKNIKIYETSIL